MRPSVLAQNARRHGFTLVEMLTVIAVIAILLSLIGPVVNSLKGAGDVNKAVYDIAGLLTQARAYAMANDTYVYIGFEEVDASQSESATPQAAGVGRIKIALIESNQGTSGYSTLTPSASWNSGYNLGKSFQQIGKVQSFDNVHLLNLGIRPTTGSMARPPYNGDAAIDPSVNIGDPNCSAVTQFSIPLGSALPPGGKFNFTKVIQFSPQGSALIQTATATATTILAPWLEIGMQKSNGATVSPAPAAPITTGNFVAIQINGATGAVRVYRP